MKLPVARRHDGLRRTMIRELFESAPPEALNLGLGQPDLVTPEPICRAAVASSTARSWSEMRPWIASIRA